MYIIVGLLLVLLLESTSSTTAAANNCVPSSCGNIGNISYPFRLQSHPPNCGTPHLELNCENNRTTLNIYQGIFNVKEISYENYTIRLVAAGLDVQDYCPIRPIFSLQRPSLYNAGEYYLTYTGENYIFFMSCPSPPLDYSSSKLYVNYSTCINNNSPSSQNYSFCAALGISSLQDIPYSCNITTVFPITLKLDYMNLTISNIHQTLLLGFELTWVMYFINPYPKWFHYFPHWIRGSLENLWYAFKFERPRVEWMNSFFHDLGYNYFSWIVGGCLLGRALIGIICLIVLVVRKCRRRHLSLDDSIEDFLKGHNNFTPIRKRRGM